MRRISTSPYIDAAHLHVGATTTRRGISLARLDYHCHHAPARFQTALLHQIRRSVLLPGLSESQPADACLVVKLLRYPLPSSRKHLSSHPSEVVQRGRHPSSVLRSPCSSPRSASSSPSCTLYCDLSSPTSSSPFSSAQQSSTSHLDSPLFYSRSSVTSSTRPHQAGSIRSHGGRRSSTATAT